MAPNPEFPNICSNPENSSDSDRILRYNRWIHRLRYLSAALVGAAGIGFVVCGIFLWTDGLLPCRVLLYLGGAIFAGLVVEQLLAAWIHSTQGRLSLLSLMLLTSGASVFFALQRISLGMALTALLAVLVLIAVLCEEKRRPVCLKSNACRIPSQGEERL